MITNDKSIRPEFAFQFLIRENPYLLHVADYIKSRGEHALAFFIHKIQNEIWSVARVCCLIAYPHAAFAMTFHFLAQVSNIIDKVTDSKWFFKNEWVVSTRSKGNLWRLKTQSKILLGNLNFWRKNLFVFLRQIVKLSTNWAAKKSENCLKRFLKKIEFERDILIKILLN